MSILSAYTHSYSVNHSALIRTSSELSDKFLLLDRDGVIIEDVNYITRSSDVRLMPNSSEFIKSAIDLGYTIAIVTNQSFKARGLAPFKSYLDVTETMFELLTHCSLPHFVLASFWHPSFSRSSSMSNWRKPNDGMFKFLVQYYGCNPCKSFMIGDKLTDLMPAAHQNVSNLIHIQTTNHSYELNKVEQWAIESAHSIKYLGCLPPSLSVLLN